MAVKKLTRNQRIFAIVTVSALIIYAFVNLGLAINGFIKLKNNIETLEDMVDNWRANTVMDVNVTTGADCSTLGSGYVNAFSSRAWSGTSNGCYCGSVSQTTLNRNNITCSPFCSGSCSSKMTGVGCSGVGGKGAQAYNNIGDISGSRTKICIKRSNEEDFATNGPQLDTSGNCASGYTKCGSGNTAFCTKETRCPITRIDVGTTADPTYCSTGIVPECSLVHYNSGTYTYIKAVRSAEYNALPLAQFSINEYSMCITEEETNKTPGRSLFYLLNERPSGCGNEGQYKWQSISTINEANLFAYNGIDVSGFAAYTGVTGMNGYYPTGKTGANYDYYTYRRGYIPWVISCRDRMKTLVDNVDKVTQTKNAQTALLVVGILSAAVLGIGLAIAELMNLAGKDLPCIKGKEEEERGRLKKIQKIVKYIFKGLQIPFQLWAIIICATIKSYFSDIGSSSCSDADMNVTMAFLASTFQSSYTSNITGIAITIASLIFDIVMGLRKEKPATDTAPQPNSPADENLALNNASQRKDVESPTPFQPFANTNNGSNFNSPAQPGNIQVNVQGGFQNNQPQYQPQPQGQPQYVQQQYIPQQQAPPQQYPPQQQQYPPQQYPPQQQQYPPQQYPNQQFPPQQYPNQYPPQQVIVQQVEGQEPKKDDDFNPTAKFGRGNYY